MAKSPSTIFTRLVLTVAARYYPTEGIVDSYCLDGRFPGRREQRSVDSMLDREDRGFLFSIFAYPYNRQEEDTSWREPLERLTEKINEPSGDIDNGLNDLADAAMDVTGRITLAEEGVREPYFSGFVLRDGEVAAVTLGDGVALLYRRGVLYPLTDETLEFNAVDSDGQPVTGINDFIAGEAGTLHYSNIAQIEQGDIFLICNQELYQALGQRDIMRILNSAEDQYDAAGLLLTSASAQVPGVSLQLMLGMVESVMEDSRKSSQLNLGRFNTLSVMGTPFDAPVPDADEQATQRYDRQDMMDFLSEPDAGTDVSGSWTEEVDENAAFRPEYSDPDDDETASFEQIEGDDRTVTPGFAYTSPEDQRRRFGHGEVYDDEVPDHDDTYDDSTYQGQVWDDSYLNDDDVYYDEEDERARYTRSSRNKQIIFYVVLIAIIALSVFALIRLLSGGGEKEAGTTEPSVTESIPRTEQPPVIVPPVESDPTEATTPPTEVEVEPEPSPEDGLYVVQPGDSPWNIIMNSYGTYSDELYAAFMEYNDKAVGDNIFAGEELLVPPQAVLDEMIGE